MNNLNNNQNSTADAIRQKLSGKTGRKYWRSLEELADTEEFRSFLEDEFPQQARPLALPIDRRQFLTLMGSALALAGLSGCRYLPQQKIVPYVKAPEDLIPGQPLTYATAMTLGGYSTGLLATSNMGRPIKIEGNDLHPASLGGTDVLAQCSILHLYDPDRAQTVTYQGEVSGWEVFLDALRIELTSHKSTGGAGICLLTESVSSPTLHSQIMAFLRTYPKAVWRQYEPVNRDNEQAGAILSFDMDVHPVYNFDHAERVVSLDGDFLGTMPGHVRYSRDFMDGRRVRKDHAVMNRLYAVECSATITGAVADHRLKTLPSRMEIITRALASYVGVPGISGTVTPAEAAWLKALAVDLLENKGHSVVVPGDQQPAVVHAISNAINLAIGAQGNTVSYIKPVHSIMERLGTAGQSMGQLESLSSLANDMDSGKVKTLIILGANPVYTAPADLDFALRLAKMTQAGKFTACLSAYSDETAALCRWNIPRAHYLEGWSDGRAYDGTLTLSQPLIQPLFESRTDHEMLAAMVGLPQAGYDIVHDAWLKYLTPKSGNTLQPSTIDPAADPEKRWQKALHDGLLEHSAFPPKTVSLKSGWESILPPPLYLPPDALEIVFRPDASAWDGRFANNAWLMELPRPLTKIVWDNAALISPATAARFTLAEGDMVEISSGSRKLTVPASLLPGHPDNSITLHLGYGRTRGGKVATGVGSNAYILRDSVSPYQAVGVTLHKTGEKYQLVSVRAHSSREGRDIVRTGTLADYLRNPKLVDERTAEEDKPTVSLYPPNKYEGFGAYAWGMSIDTNLCIGCNACVAACQAENNIPVVGKDQVSRGREMHWLRVDRYYQGEINNPDTVFSPVPCMHCENAPCEPVCPVAATVHSHEGLNQQVYNRCVGTRYCSNNCPYKVRHFNFYKYSAGQPNNAPGNYDIPILKLLANPDVTIRGRGVMEKCTYCVQRINHARQTAKTEDREIRDGEVVTACQQACPPKAINFGNINDPHSQVAEWKKEEADYSILGELNTRPRTTYLPRLRNPNPDIKDG